MRIAFYNIENLFFRHRELLKASENKCIRNWREEMDLLVHQPGKALAELTRLKELAFLLGFERKDVTRYGILHKYGTSIHLRPESLPLQLKAAPENSWNGWVEVENVPLSTTAVELKARVITEADADLLLLQQVEDRRSLEDFNYRVLAQNPLQKYNEFTVVQGINFRGAEQAVVSRSGISVKQVHFPDPQKTAEGEVLNRNLLVYQIVWAHHPNLWIILAELCPDSKPKEKSDKRRLEQCSQIAAIYQELRDKNYQHIIVAGTFHAVSYCYSLAPVLRDTDLYNIVRHEEFHVQKDHGRAGEYHSLGAFRKGVNMKQNDYLLVSPELRKGIRSCGMIRKGIWPGSPSQWGAYPGLKKESHQASSHPLLWVDLDL